MKIKYKITALFTLLVTAILLLLSYSVYYFTSLERLDAFKQRLQSRASNSAQLFSLFNDTDNTDSARAVLSRFDSASAYPLPYKSVAIYNYLDDRLYSFNATGADTLTITRSMLRNARLNEQVYFTDKKRDAIALYHKGASSRIVVVVAAYDADGWERLAELKKILLFSLVIGICFTAAVGYLFSIQLVKPISRIIHEVNDISSQNLSYRIHAGASQDELNQLAGTFNELLNRLQESFNIQRRFISNASHELSTPLTSISSQLDVTLNKERSMEEYKQVMQSVREDVRHMQQLTKSLLEIAKTGSQGGIELEEVRLDEVLFKVMGDVMKANSQYRVKVHFGEFPDDEKSFLVFGNNELLYSALRNIIENGCKYSPDHVSWVELAFKNEEVTIHVKNDGDIIAEDEIEHIFQPFYRIDPSSETSGFGLGLPLAKRIISLHKGNIYVQSDIATGTIFSITLPSVKAFASR